MRTRWALPKWIQRRSFRTTENPNVALSGLVWVAFSVGCGKPPSATRVVLPAGVKPVRRSGASSESKLLAGLRAKHGKSPVVDAVCRVNGAEVECWNPLGGMDSALTERAKAALQKYGKSVPKISGRENRVVLVYPAADPSWTLSPDQSPSLVVRPIGDRKDLVLVAALTTEPFTHLKFEQIVPASKPVPIQLKRGASASAVGLEFEVVSVVRLPGRWRVTVLPKTPVSRGFRGLVVQSLNQDRSPGVTLGGNTFEMNSDPSEVRAVFSVLQTSSVSSLGFPMSPR